MTGTNPTDAKARVSKAIDQIETGDSIDVTRHGKPVAQLTAIAKPRMPVDSTLFQLLTAAMPPQFLTAGDLVRSMRNSDRY